MLVTSIFSFPHIVFKMPSSSGSLKLGSRGKKLIHLQKVSFHVTLHNPYRLTLGEYFCHLINYLVFKGPVYSQVQSMIYQIDINPFLNKPWFLHVFHRSLSKTPWEKEKLLVTSNFSFSHSVFFPFKELSVIFIKFQIVVCNLFQFRRV